MQDSGWLTPTVEFINGGTHSACVQKPIMLCLVCFSDLLAVPKHPYAAMENWGLSVFVEQKILLDAEVSSSSYQMELTMVVVHEICHQVETFNTVYLLLIFVVYYKSQRGPPTLNVWF